MRLSTVAVALILLALATAASAHSGNDDPQMVHACIGNITKVVRIVGASGSCISAPPWLAETPVHWPRVVTTGGTRPDPPCFDNTNRYVNCNNGTVTDTVTGLVWLRQADCFNQRDYAAANNAAALLASGQCGLTDNSVAGDWRLPTVDEWRQTTKYLGCANPSLTNDAGTGCFGDGTGSSFIGVVSAGVYWSSSSAGNFPSVAWAAFLNGYVFNQIAKDDTTLRVWPVRGALGCNNPGYPAYCQ